MLVALDIETIPNPATFCLLPEPKPSKNIKDPDKIEADIAKKKSAQVEKAALDPLFGRVACFAAVGMVDGKENEFVKAVESIDNNGERNMLQVLFASIANPEIRLVTWNGIGFDLPFIYKRALLLGVDLDGAPPLTTWTKRYSTDRHYDLMQIWGGWKPNEYAKLNTVAALLLRERKNELDVTKIAEMLENEEGKKEVTQYCLQDTRLTWRMFNKMNGYLFA